MHKFNHLRPDSGLIAQYWPFIMKEMKYYTQKYFLPASDVVCEAVRLAVIAEEKFKPELGHDFSTFLRWHLMGLHRYCKKEYPERHAPRAPDATRRRYSRRRGGWPGVWSTEDDPPREPRLIKWTHFRPALSRLEQNQQNSLRLTEKAVLDWMLKPGGRKMSDVAEWIGCHKSYASKIRYNLLRKAGFRHIEGKVSSYGVIYRI